MTTEPTGTTTFEGRKVEYITITPTPEARLAMLGAAFHGYLEGVADAKRRYKRAKTDSAIVTELRALVEVLDQAAKCGKAIVAMFDEPAEGRKE